MSDKDIIQRIIERPEYQKYLTLGRPETDQSESYFNDFFGSLLRYLYNLLSKAFENTDMDQGLDLVEFMLKSLKDSPFLKTLAIISTIVVCFWIYRHISKIRLSKRGASLPDEPSVNWKELAHMPDAWQDLIKNILNHYLASLRMNLQPHMTLRQCLKILVDNKRDDVFIRELVDFLEKWHFSNWQPDQKVIQSWFVTIKEKSERFQELKLEAVYE